MAGRPSSLTDERRETIERALAAGAPVSIAASAAGVSTRTVFRALEDGRVVRRSLSAVQDDDERRDVLEDDETLQRALLGVVLRAAKNGDWRAATWILAKRWPTRYGR